LSIRIAPQLACTDRCYSPTVDSIARIINNFVHDWDRIAGAFRTVLTRAAKSNLTRNTDLDRYERETDLNPEQKQFLHRLREAWAWEDAMTMECADPRTSKFRMQKPPDVSVEAYVARLKQ
jgi:hypothetical protein